MYECNDSDGDDDEARTDSRMDSCSVISHKTTAVRAHLPLFLDGTVRGFFCSGNWPNDAIYYRPKIGFP